MQSRFTALLEVGRRLAKDGHVKKNSISDQFASRVFCIKAMERVLPKEIFLHIKNVIEGRDKIKPEYANIIAHSMKEWAISLGATHYCHWFQPLTGSSAEKHDSFIDWKTNDSVIERFDGKQLFQSEPDASSFPSGGLRSTYEARGYTGWDPSSPAFIWEAGDGFTLCIPSIFFSWTGDVLDNKIPVLKSESKLNEAVLRLLKYTGTFANQVFSTLGWEQEYFVIDRALRNIRSDLLLLGKTVYGARPPKGQELEDHYFGAVKDRVLSFMKEFEDKAIRLGIPVKTRHNEVAPAQHEIAPIFEKSSIAIDHNILLMELMRQVAASHNLSCLLHEKPFAGINGSGKHNNWSLSTDTGVNLLDPTESPEQSMQFLILLTSILHAVHKHSILLRASVGSHGNDYRLGANEAPPAIISVYLGDFLEKFLENIENGNNHKSPSKLHYNLGILVIPDMPKDNTDRNRTSPFAFTGNKFEFRAVGSSSSCAFPITVLNVIVAESLNEIMDQIEKSLPNSSTKEQFEEVALAVIREKLKASKSIRFGGDNYSQEWEEEAAKRGLPNIKKSFHSFDVLLNSQTEAVFKNVLNSHELNSRYSILVETYLKTCTIEINLMLDIFKTQILPAAIKSQNQEAKAIKRLQDLNFSPESYEMQKNNLQKMTDALNIAIHSINVLEEKKKNCELLSHHERGAMYCDEIIPFAGEVRTHVDLLETLVDDTLWPLPKYRELLFLV